MMVVYNVQKDAMLPGDGWDPTTGTARRQDGGWRRVRRGYGKRSVPSLFHTGLFLALGILSARCGLLVLFVEWQLEFQLQKSVR